MRAIQINLRLRAAQNDAAATMSGSNVFMLDIDGAQFSTLTPYASPGLHFDTGGQRALGAAFAQAVRNALPPPQLQPPAKSGGVWNLSFTGVTGTVQRLERANALTGPWTLLTNLILNSLGGYNFEDQNPPGSAVFYRVSRP